MSESLVLWIMAIYNEFRWTDLLRRESSGDLFRSAAKRRLKGLCVYMMARPELFEIRYSDYFESFHEMVEWGIFPDCTRYTPTTVQLEKVGVFRPNFVRFSHGAQLLSYCTGEHADDLDVLLTHVQLPKIDWNEAVAHICRMALSNTRFYMSWEPIDVLVQRGIVNPISTFNVRDLRTVENWREMAEYSERFPIDRRVRMGFFEEKINSWVSDRVDWFTTVFNLLWIDCDLR